MKTYESDNLLLEEQSSTPATPSTGKNRLYFKSDWSLYKLDDTWTETQILDWSWWWWYIMFMWWASMNYNYTYYMSPAWNQSTEAYVQIPVTKAGTINSLYVNVASNTVNNIMTIVVRKNWVDTWITLNVIASSTWVFSTTWSVTIALWDKICVRAQTFGSNWSNWFTVSIGIS